MGVSFSYLMSKYVDVENGLESIIVKSMYFANEEAKTVVRSVSFGEGESQPTIRKSTGCGNNMALEASVNVRTIEPTSADFRNTKPEEVQSPTSKLLLQVLDPSNPKHDAAIKLQKVYKSFRTRRKLADCAVLIQERWWEILDFVELKNSSISFFDEGKPETAISRWSRARTRAAKVGKGLSKNDKGQKLALQHWLEAIDPRHRYGHNLHFYYVKWLHSQSREPFFYWLDVGEGKEVNLIDKCSRSKLQQQCIKYLGPIERKAYEVSLEDGKLFYKQSGKPIHTVGEPGDVKWIFVLSTSKTMYVGRKKKGSFQHSSFLAGGAALAAGRLVVEDGILKAAWPHSGHYRPTAENFQDFLSFMQENDVDLTNVQLSPADEGEYSLSRSGTLRSNPSVENLARNFNPSEVVAKNITEEMRISEEKDAIAEPRSPQPSRIQRFGEKLTSLEIPKKSESIEKFERDNPDVDSPLGGYETTEDAMVSALDKKDPKNMEKEPLQRGSVAVRKWTTGAGPRIRYVRDYPPELQVRALEHVNLSPRSAGLSRSYFSPRNASGLSPVRLSSTALEKEHSLDRIIHLRPKSTLCISLPD